MNILMMTNTFTPHVGGVARSVASFSAAYRARGHRVMVVAPEFEDMPESERDVIRVPAIQHFRRVLELSCTAVGSSATAGPQRCAIVIATMTTRRSAPSSPMSRNMWLTFVSPTRWVRPDCKGHPISQATHLPATGITGKHRASGCRRAVAAKPRPLAAAEWLRPTFAGFH